MWLLLSVVLGWDATAPPAVYWVSAPTLANETVLVAGAGLAGATALWCNTTSMCHPSQPELAEAWESSIKAVMPADCGPPCTLRIVSGTPHPASSRTGDSAAAAVDVAINVPDLWWATAADPGATGMPRLRAEARAPALSAAPAVEAMVRIGGRLRVFGRGLGWAVDTKGAGHRCRNASLPPAPAAGTTLELELTGTGAATIKLSAAAASCYEANFDLAADLGIPAGRYNAHVRTVWGLSQALGVTVVHAAASVAPAVLLVDRSFGGSIEAALVAAAALARNATPGAPPAEVRLVCQLKHYFGPFHTWFSAALCPLTSPLQAGCDLVTLGAPHMGAVCHARLSAHALWMLIGACDLMYHAQSTSPGRAALLDPHPARGPGPHHHHRRRRRKDGAVRDTDGAVAKDRRSLRGADPRAGLQERRVQRHEGVG